MSDFDRAVCTHTSVPIAFSLCNAAHAPQSTAMPRQRKYQIKNKLKEDNPK